MFREVHADVEEDLLEARDGQLGLDLGWRRSDLANRFEDRCSRGDDVVSGDGLVPIPAVL